MNVVVPARSASTFAHPAEPLYTADPYAKTEAGNRHASGT